MVIYGVFGSDMQEVFLTLQEVFMTYFKVYATISMNGHRTTCNTSGRVAVLWKQKALLLTATL
jgi:hypothetical protein